VTTVRRENTNRQEPDGQARTRHGSLIRDREGRRRTLPVPRTARSQCLLDSRERRPPLWTTSSAPGWVYNGTRASGSTANTERRCGSHSMAMAPMRTRASMRALPVESGPDVRTGDPEGQKRPMSRDGRCPARARRPECHVGVRAHPSRGTRSASSASSETSSSRRDARPFPERSPNTRLPTAGVGWPMPDFRQTYLEQLVGPDPIVVGIK
jgi:hypothetical protein